MSIEDITVVITSFRSEKKIINCLNSINKVCKVINIENSNNFNFKKKIEAEYNNVKCILAGENFGYGTANNLGLKETKTKYALILNPDAELYKNTLDNFLSAAKALPDFAIIGPNIIEDKSNIDLEVQKQKKFSYLEVQSVKGYAMFLNLSEFKDIGFFDEKIFIYLEEIDLCKRLLKNNKKIYQCENILIHHQGGQSHDNSIDYEMELSRNWHWMWSTFYYNKKYKGFFLSLLSILPKLFTSIIKTLIYTLLNNKEKKEIYYQRLSGLFNAIIGRSSWYRPKVKLNIDL